MIWSWFHRHPRLVDVLLAAALVPPTLTVTASRGPFPTAVLLTALMTVPLAFRRQRPLLVLALVTAAAALTHGTNRFFPGPLAVAAYTVAVVLPRRVALVALAVSSTALAAVLVQRHRLGPSEVLAEIVFVVGAWSIGDAVRSRRAYVRSIEEKAERLEREREQEALRVAAEEKARIARELHDVVAHSLSVVLVQASAAEDVFESAPGQSRQALRAVSETARAALLDLRRVLGALDDDAEFAPQPQLATLPELVEQVRGTGLDVQLDIVGELRPLPAAVDLSAYRIVQEALTNTLKHAHARHATVTVRYGAELEIEVQDDGVGANGIGRSGRGLIGMRERVGMLGGSLDAGPAAGGGYAIAARIPISVAS
jgi:signal transduction histidine kinase